MFIIFEGRGAGEQDIPKWVDVRVVLWGIYDAE
jgi:hypothetical protein